MRTHRLVLLSIAIALPSLAQERGPTDDYFPPEPGFESITPGDRDWRVTAGFGDSNTGGDFRNASGLSGGRAGEYTDDGPAPYVDGLLRWQNPSTLLRASGRLRTEDEFAALLTADVGRRFTSRTRVTSFIHRLDHDPLANNLLRPPAEVFAEALINDGKINAFDPNEVTFETFDAAPDKIGQLRRFLMESDHQIHLGRDVTVVQGVRIERRTGTRFAKTLDNAHEPGVSATTTCLSCHLAQLPQGLDQTTTDVRIGVLTQQGRLAVEADYLYRQFADSSDQLLFAYGNPDLRDPGKVGAQFPQRRPHVIDGLNEFGHAPDSTKSLFGVRARYDINDDHSVSAHGNYARYRNEHLDQPSTFGFVDDKDNAKFTPTARAHHDLNIGRGLAEVLAGGGSYTGLFKQRLRIDLRGRYEDYATDIVGGGAMEEDLERRTLTLKGSAGIGTGKGGLRSRSSVEYRDRDRADWFVPSTERWRFRTELDLRGGRVLAATARYGHETTNHPFANPADQVKRPRGGLELFDAFGATNQFYQTSQPTEVDDYQFSVRWTQHPRVTLLGTWRGAYSKNPDVGLDQDAWFATGVAWFALPGRTSLVATMSRAETDIVADLYFGDAISLVPNFAGDGLEVITRSPSGAALLDIFRVDGVPYDSDSTDAILSLRTERDSGLRLQGQVRWGRHQQRMTIGRATTLVGDEVLASPCPRPGDAPCPPTLVLAEGIDALSATDIRQFGFEVEAEIPVRNRISVFAHGSYEDYQDRAERRPVVVRGSSDFFLVYGGLRLRP